MTIQTSTLSWHSGTGLGDAPAGLGERALEWLIAGEACYSAARIHASKPKWAQRHARRLKRDARALGLGEVAEEDVLLALSELGAAAFSKRGMDGNGIVRIVAFRGAEGQLELYALPEEFTPEPDEWRAVLAPFAHDMEGRVWTGAKGSNLPLYNRARALMAERGMQEVLLVDGDDCVVEGCRSNIFVVDAGGALVAPNLSRGAVAGLAQEIVHEHIPRSWFETWNLSNSPRRARSSR